MAVNKSDFIEIEYSAKTREDNTVFDKTEKPIIICLGNGYLLPKLEQDLIGKEVGKYTVSLKAEESFGKKDVKLVQLVPTKEFLSKNIQPSPGLRIDVDGAIATIKSVSGGRTLVDFNHPLAGKDVVYEIEIKRVVTDSQEKIKSLLDMAGLKDFTLTSDNNKFSVKIKEDLPKEIVDQLQNRIKELTSAEVLISRQ